MQSWLQSNLRRIRENDPRADLFEADNRDLQHMSDDEWEQLGRDISNNTHLRTVCFKNGSLNDNKMSFLYRGLARSGSIKYMHLYRNQLSVTGVRCMVPFLQNANNLSMLNLFENNLQSEGFNLLFRALSDSPIETLQCCRCGIESIEIEREHIPRNLNRFYLEGNNITVDGCRELAKLLQGGDATLTELHLNNNNTIDDIGVSNLVDALKNNTSLTRLNFTGNDGISVIGMAVLLKLVNDVSSIKATLQSNHTLEEIRVSLYDSVILSYINTALGINRRNNPEAVGRMKAIQTQLHSVKRAELMELQGVNQSIFNEIDPLLLPEVFSLVGRHHGQGELYFALKSSIAGVISTLNRKKFLKQEIARREAIIAEHRAIIAQHKAKVTEQRAKVAAIEAQIAAIEDEGDAVDIGSESRSSKRRRV